MALVGGLGAPPPARGAFDGLQPSTHEDMGGPCRSQSDCAHLSEEAECCVDTSGTATCLMPGEQENSCSSGTPVCSTVSDCPFFGGPYSCCPTANGVMGCLAGGTCNGTVPPGGSGCLATSYCQQTGASDTGQFCCSGSRPGRTGACRCRSDGRGDRRRHVRRTGANLLRERQDVQRLARLHGRKHLQSARSGIER
jgi:hypothetical protein